jgi:DNA-binding GntR family transcriptional regulator
MATMPYVAPGWGALRDSDMDERVRQVDNSTLQDRVYQELRNALYQGRFLPGDQLTIRSLARALGTSPMPVREAMQRLVAEQALVQLPNRTIRVPALTPDILTELVRIRMEVEGYAAERAARRGSAALCRQLRAINEGFRQAIEAEDAAGMLEGNQRFHFAVYQAADAGELLKIIETLWLRSGPIVASERNVPGSVAMFARGVQVHERIAAAIERRDAAAARFALALDIRAAAAWFRHHHGFEATGGSSARLDAPIGRTI